MKKTNKLISILLVFAMLLSMAPLSLTASAADIEVYATGTLGSGSRTAWTIYDNGLLVIDGKGNSISTKWNSTTASPWKDYADIITRVSFVNCENWECIPECTFRSLSNLKDVTLPENIEEICQYAFTGTAIETITLPDGLITIGYYAFSSCESLKYININDGVTSIGSSAFYNCSSLKAISIPDSVTSIGQTLFQNCTNLEYVRLSENADKVGGSMFFGCTMLKNVSLPASVTVIGSKAFSNASNLEGVYYHGINEPTTYNPGINNATFSLAPDTMVIYASNDYSGTTMGLKANWENDVQTVTKIEGHFVNIAHTANGAVKVGASIVPAGDTVTIDIMAYKNYELDTITVTDSNGQVELSGSGHSRTFSMPEGDVRISATFKSTATPHVHSWTYAANGATITATCAYADTCHNPISKVEISKGNTSSLTFRPDNAKYMTVSGTMEDVVIPDLVYTLKSTGEPATPINPGVYVASLTIENVTATYEFEITRGKFDYTYFTYTAPQNLTYDGTPKYASVVMSEDYVPYAGEYTVYYNSGTTEPINAGTYTVKVNVAESDYFTAGTALSGRAWRFTIAPKSIEDLTYEGLGTSYPVGATPDVTIKHGDMVLVKDTDYTVEYANNTELGTATMTVTGVGNYTGSKTLEFEIVPHTHSFTYSASGDTITAVCANADGNCPDPEGTLTILAPADLYVDGTAKEATVENNLVDTSVAISYIIYSAPYGLPPKDAGTYTASVTVGGATATVEFTLLNYAAKVTDKDGNAVGTYKTLADAITAAQGSEGSTVTLLDDITLTTRQDISSGKFTFDLNGKNLINENGRVLYILEEADLTIKDSGEGGTVETKRMYVDCIDNSGKLTVESGIIKGDGGIRNHGVLYFNDGTVEADNYPAIANYNDSTVYVYDGVLKGGKNSGAVENGGTLYVYGGEIESILNANDAYISGGKIDRDDYVALNLLGGTVEITGGSFTGTDFSDGYFSGTPYGEWTVDINEGATLILKGGEFPNGFVVANTTANAFLAEDYYYKDADGKLITVSDDAKVIDGYVKVSKGADLADAVITLDSTEFTYNGSEIKPTVIVTVGGKTLTESKDYTLTFANNVNAGTATVTVTGAGDYTGEATKEFTIVKADNTVNAAPVPNTLTYNGEAHNLISAGEAMYGTMIYSLDGAEYSETIPQGTNAGYYTVYYKVIGDANHADTEPETVTVTIDKKAVTVSATVPDRIYGDDYRVDTSKVVITFDGIVEGDDVGYVVTDAYYHVHTVTDNAPVQVDYNVNGADSDNYQFPEFGDWIAPNYGVQATGRVLPRNIANAEITLGDALVYNGTEQTQTVTAVTVDGLEVTYTVSGNKATNVGVYELTITGNGNFTGTKTALYTINPDLSGIEGLDQYNVKSTNKADIEYVYNQLDNAVTDLASAEKEAEWKEIKDECWQWLKILESVAYRVESLGNSHLAYDIDTVTSADDEALLSLEAEMYLFMRDYRDNMTEEELLKVDNARIEISKLRDRIAETKSEYDRLIAAANGYDEATVTSADKDDLVQLNDDIYALALTDNVTAEELENLENAHDKILGLIDKLTDISDEIKRIIEAVDKYVFESVKSSDKADIQQLIADIKALLDTQNITADERALLEGADETCTKLIEKIDETVAEINRINDATNSYDIDTVTSADKADIEKLLADIKALTDGDNVTDAGREQLNGNEATLNALLDKIGATADEIARIETAVNGYDEETVKSTDSENLAQLKEDIQNLIDSDNTTESEKTALEEMIKDIEGLEDKIAETEQQLEDIKDIENNFNPETVSSDDKAAIEEAIDEIEAVNPDNLTDEQKAEYEEIKAGFEALLEEIAAAEKNVADIGAQLEMFDEKRVTKFWEDDIEALKAKIDELLADENMGETEKAKLNEYKAQAEKLIKIINDPCEYFSLRFFYLIWDCLTWKYNGILWLFSKIFG